MQVIGDFNRIEWLEEGLNHVAEADDKNVKLINSFRAKCVSTLVRTGRLSDIIVKADLMLTILDIRLVEMAEGVVTHVGRHVRSL